MTPAQYLSTRPDRRSPVERLRARQPAAAARELDHRIANSLQLAANMLLLQQVRLTDPIACAALADAAERLVAVGQLHRFLASHAERSTVELCGYLEELAGLISQGTGLKCRAEAPAGTRVCADIAQQLGIAVNELAINAAKHAYGRGEPGELSIRAASENGALRVSVADRGRGLGEGFDPARSHGLGFGIVQAIARQLGARLEARDDQGARFTLVLPAPPGPAAAEPRSFDPPR